MFNKIKDVCMNALAWAKRKPFLAAGLVLVLLIGGNLAMVQAEKHPSLACAPCHNMSSYGDGYQGKGDKGMVLAQKHAEAGIACIDCHENGIADKAMETYWYITDDFEVPTLKRDFGNEMCTKCHKVDEIIAKTDKGNGINPHNSHLGDLNCEDCHKMHDRSEAACMKCHDFDFLSNLPGEWMTKDEMKAAQQQKK